MVKIALAGGSGGLGREILDALIARNKHDLIVLTRQEPSKVTLPDGVQAVQTDYTERSQIADALKGVDTVLSFIITGKDPGNASQKNLIDACVEAKVRRFAPSDWSAASPAVIPWYAGKTAISSYLQQINSEKKVLEYCRFMPGVFLDYIAYPKKTAKHFENIGMQVDVQNCRAILLGDVKSSKKMGLTTAQDTANVVAEAVDWPGEWPVDGGMRGAFLTLEEVVERCEKIRGKKFDIEYVKLSQVRAGRLPTTWVPPFVHSAIPEEFRESFSRTFIAKSLYASHVGAYGVPDTWNRLLPDYSFTGLEEFLGKWYGKEDGHNSL